MMKDENCKDRTIDETLFYNIQLETKNKSKV